MLAVCLAASQATTSVVQFLYEGLKAEVLNLTQLSVFWPL